MDKPQSSEKWEELMSSIRELAEWFPDSMILIGGVAVYLHAMNGIHENLAEHSHDADFLLSMAAYSDLRDIEEVTKNTRLGKSQIIKNGFDFDIYVERQNSLSVPYADIAESSSLILGLRCASLEHLLALKADAYLNRKGSAKGDKDERDIARIVIFMDSPDAKAASKWVDEDRMDAIQSVSKKNDAFESMAGGNAHFAKELKSTFKKNLSVLKDEIENYLRGGFQPT